MLDYRAAIACLLLTCLGTAQTAPPPAPAAPTHKTAPSLQPAVAIIEQAITDGAMLGAVLYVARGSEVLLHSAHGHADLARERPLAKDALFRMASNTKAVTAAAVLALAEDGVLQLSDPVSRWLPTFANGDAAKITIEHLLTHSSGLRIPTLFVQPMMRKSEQHPDAPNLVLEALRFGEVGPAVAPGTSYAYSNPGYNALAAIVEVAAKQPFATFCERRFYQPLGIRECFHHESLATPSRMGDVVKPDPKGGWQRVWSPSHAPTVPFVRGSGGMITTASDYARFARLWLDDGRVGEKRLLASAMVKAATSNRIPHIEGARYGYGWVPDGAEQFSHTGSDGTLVWCDRRRDLVGMVLTQTQGGDALARARRSFRAKIGELLP